MQNRIQEDNLQHLALFTEYGRIAHSKQREAAGAAAGGTADGSAAAFQHLEFLVRDWQEFEGLEDGELLSKVGEMDGYLAEVLETESRVRVPPSPLPWNKEEGRGRRKKATMTHQPP